MSNYLALRQEIEQDLSDRITNDWLEEADACDYDLITGSIIGCPVRQVFADIFLDKKG